MFIKAEKVSILPKLIIFIMKNVSGKFTDIWLPNSTSVVHYADC